MTAWLQVANRRIHRVLQARPADRWEADRAGMLALPGVGPGHWWRFQTRLGRDHYIRVDTCDYSVHPAAIGRQVTVLTDTDQVRVVTTDGELVAEHPRCWARHQTLTDPDHAEAGRRMRHHAAQQQLRQAPNPSPAVVEVEQRALDSYDRLFTVIDGGGADREAS